MQPVLRKFLWVVVALSGAASTAMLFIGSQVTGISMDESAHVDDLFGPQRAGDVNELHFGIYGVSFQLLGHAAAVLFAGEPIGDTNYEAEAFLARHLVSAALTLLAAVATGLIVYIITNLRLLAAWAAVALLSVPVFLGHGMFNPKDIPVAVGYTFVTLGCVSWLNSLVNARSTGKLVVAQTLLVAFGIWIAVGTRYLFSVVVLASLLVTLGLGMAISRKWLRHPGVWLKPGSFVPVWGALLGSGFLYLTNPCLLMPNNTSECQFADLFSRTFSGSSAIAQGQPLFLLGTIYTQEDKPWYSLPLNLLAGAPVFLWILCFLGLGVIAASFFWRTSLKSGSSGSGQISAYRKVFLLVPVFLQAALLPLLTVITNSSVYDMQRQHLYFYPAVVVSAAVGLSCLLNFSPSGVAQSRVTQALGVVAFCGAIVVPVYEGFRLYPYNYVYVNPAASISGFPSNWETDYWALSLREAVRKVPKGAPFSIVGPPGSVGPFLFEQGSAKFLESSAVGSSEVIGIQLHRPSFDLGRPVEGCRLRDVVQRDLRGEGLPMSYIVVCSESSLGRYQKFP